MQKNDLKLQGGVRVGAGRPRNEIRRHCFSMYGSDDEEKIIKILFKFIRNEFVDENDTKLAAKFFKSIRGRLTV